MSPVGFIGLGIMGKGMLCNLCTKLPDGTSFVVWNRSPEACAEIQSRFPGKISIAQSAADVVRQCDVTYTMLSNLEASISVFDSPDGVVAGVSQGKIIVDCATLSPERMQAESAAVTGKGGRFLEAPVSGSKAPAEQGTLIFLCGGDETVYTEVSQALDAMGKAKFFFGPVGKGSEVKLVVNMIMGSMMGAFSEGLALGRANDLPLDSLLQVLDLGAMSNPMFRGKGPNMLAGNHAPNFPLKHAQKDMGLALALAERQGVTLPTAAAANSLMLKAMTKHPETAGEDFSATYKAL